jgi:hypothetical protein
LHKKKKAQERLIDLEQRNKKNFRCTKSGAGMTNYRTKSGAGMTAKGVRAYKQTLEVN